ncbi:MAG TPA: ATP-binding protein [Bryobacteraceae bacterium]|nr:ATP-binding protein [Bryobacteraceae bacterium]
MAEPSKGIPGPGRPWLHSLATKFSIFSATLTLWIGVTIVAFDLRHDAFDTGKGFLLVVVILLVSAAIARFATRLLARPLARLENGIRDVENGKLEPIEVSQTGDEIQFLGESFNRMIMGLASSEKQIRENRELLEKRIHDRTSRLEQAMRSAQKANEAKTEFLANVSHDLRTPMNGVLGMLDITLDHELPPEVREQLQTAHRCARSLLLLLNDILDMSKIEAGRMTLEKISFDIRTLLEDCIKSHQAKAAENRVELRFEVSPEVPEQIVGDPLRIRQILWNLIGNAVKFTEDGAVTVWICHQSASEGAASMLEITVQDTGTGIPADKLLSIFEKFTQADGSVTRRFGGTGLGLAITKKLVELHHGELRVESELGYGSTFTATLQYDAQDAPQELALSSAAAPIKAAFDRARILVVEDNRVNQKVVTAVLAKRGYAIELANDGREALAKLEQMGPFDLILMDVQMPVLDGLEATRTIRRDPRWRTVPVIAMTAHAMTGDREICLEAGMNAYVSKPVSPDHLLQVMDEYLVHRPAESGAESTLTADFARQGGGV